MGKNQDDGGQNQLEKKNKDAVIETAILKTPALHAVDPFFDPEVIKAYVDFVDILMYASIITQECR